MQNFNYKGDSYNARTDLRHDEGLRQYFLKIYALMSSGLLITAIAAFAVFSIPALTSLMFNVEMGYVTGMTPVGWIITFAPLGIALYFSFGFDRINAQNAQLLFWIYSGLMGMSLASLGFTYTGTSIARTLFICSSMFGGMSIYGYTTKKDLTSMGSFLYMGLMGLVLTSVINMFLQSSAVEFALSVVAVLVFTGLIAYDTQKLKALYYQGSDNSDKMGVMAAFTLYLDFINLFIFLLRFLGVRRGNE